MALRFKQVGTQVDENKNKNNRRQLIRSRIDVIGVFVAVECGALLRARGCRSVLAEVAEDGPWWSVTRHGRRAQSRVAGGIQYVSEQTLIYQEITASLDGKMT